MTQLRWREVYSPETAPTGTVVVASGLLAGGVTSYFVLEMRVPTAANLLGDPLWYPIPIEWIGPGNKG